MIYEFIDPFQDPRSKLAKNGISWKNDNFIAAIENNDFDSIKLFSKGGMKLNSYYFKSFINNYYSEEAKKIFVKYKVLSSNSCPIDYDLSFYTDFSKHTQKQNLIKLICNTPTVTNKLNQLLLKEKQKEQEQLKKNSNRNLSILKCIKRNSNLTSDFSKTLDEISSSNLLSGRPLNERDSILLALLTSVSSGGLNYKNFEETVELKVKEVCSDINPTVKFNPLKLKSIKSAITSLTDT